MAMNEYELEEIKREIVESRALTIKTNNLVNALAADLKSISKRQQGAERKVVFSSATAYVVTIAVLLVIVKLAWDIRLDNVKAETKEKLEQLESLQKDVKAAQERDEAAKRSSRQAADFYQLIVQSKRQELIAAYPDVVKLDLTPTEHAVFDAAFERAKNELSLIAYQTGVDHIRMARWHEATQAFRESLKYKSDAAHSPQANLQLSHALIQLGN
ncbi:MAG TPA: hypothetical protein VGM29_18055, partial [Polyangiaceae bacterium]